MAAPKIPVTMRAAAVDRFGLPAVLTPQTLPVPKVGPRDVLIAVHELAARVPRRLNLLEVGAAATTGLTALQRIDDVLRLRRNDTVLIFGASRAVGTLAVQFAKRHKARVLATASGRAAASLVRSLGADAVIDARRRDDIDRLHTLAPNGIDAALVLAGGDSAEACLRFVRAAEWHILTESSLRRGAGATFASVHTTRKQDRNNLRS
jgi:NADPH:quinone reductase-like Zn-dependent oxidoreductase